MPPPPHGAEVLPRDLWEDQRRGAGHRPLLVRSQGGGHAGPAHAGWRSAPLTACLPAAAPGLLQRVLLYKQCSWREACPAHWRNSVALPLCCCSAYNNHHLQLFSSCMFLAGAVMAVPAGHITRAVGRKVRTAAATSRAAHHSKRACWLHGDSP